MLNNPAPKNESTIRVATINTWADDITSRARMEALIAWVHALDIDILLLQEIHPDTTQLWLEPITCDTHLSHAHAPDPNTCSNAIASRFPLTNTGLINIPGDRSRWPQTGKAAYAYMRTPAGHEMAVVSAHLAWGPLSEWTRWQQLAAIDTWATRMHGPVTNKDCPRVILGGDLNCEPDNEAIRWITGKTVMPRPPHASTIWTDAWLKAGMRYGDPHGITSSPRNLHAHHTAATFAGIQDPTLLPDRRIDYILVRGYAHGIPGTPVQAGTWGDAHLHPGPSIDVSDHYGVWADLTDPQR